jgi:AcrR family transcriptional regulator
MVKAAPRRKVRRLPPEKRIADILAAAKAVFEEKGYNDALISDIAVRAGVVEGSIYRFFTNKRELLVKVIEQWYVSMLARYEADFPAVQGTWNQIHFLIHQHLLAIKSEPGLARLLLLEIRLEPDYRQSNFFLLNRAYTSRITEVVKLAIATGEFRPDLSPTMVRDLIYGTIEHRAWVFLRREGELDTASVTEGIINILRGGLGTSHQPSGETPGMAERLERATADLEAVTARLTDVLASSAPSVKS